MVCSRGKRGSLLLVFFAKAEVGFSIFGKVFVAVETHILPDIDAYQEIIARHIRRENQIFIDLLNQLAQVRLLQLPFQNKRAVYGSSGEMNIYSAQTTIILQGITLHDVIALRVGRAKMPFKANIVHNRVLSRSQAGSWVETAPLPRPPFSSSAASLLPCG